MVQVTLDGCMEKTANRFILIILHKTELQKDEEPQNEA